MSDLTCLNASQREAVTFGEGPLLLLAGPGSGKTFTITQRILYLIRERRITPEKLLVITFTREAALSMRQRFAQISPQEALTVNFGTFHSVFYQQNFIRKYFKRQTKKRSYPSHFEENNRL